METRPPPSTPSVANANAAPANSTEKQNSAPHAAGGVSTAQKQTSVASSSTPLLHEQILDIKQPIAQFIINTLLQVLAFAFTIAFGVYAIKSVQVALRANEYASQALSQARTANQLTLLTFCLSITNASRTADFAPICSSVQDAAESMISGTASALFTNLPPPTSTNGVTSGSPPSASSSSNIVGLAVGVSLGGIVALLVGGCFIYTCLRRRKRKVMRTESVDRPQAGEGLAQPQLRHRTLGNRFRETFMDTRVIAHIR